MRKRLDQILSDRGLVRSRAQAQDLVRRGLVLLDGVVARKAGQPVGEAVSLEIASDEAGMVSRGGVKLAAALDAFGFDPADIIALDVGASTGGFTQILVGRGACRVHAIDIGQGQFDDRLRTDPRIFVHEGTDARRLGREMLGDVEIGAVVADLSFISVTEALGPALDLAAPGAWAVVLVKPQFEVGREGVGKGGIVRDEVLREGAVEKVAAWLRKRGWQIAGRIVSPITGGSGNIEYLVGARRLGGQKDGTGMGVEREFEIRALGAQGDGMAEAEDGPVFVPFALPGERWAMGEDGTARQLTTAQDRAPPPCRHFGNCGGCRTQHMADDLYARWKEGVVREAFRHRGLSPAVVPLVRVPPGSRRRAVLGAAIKDGRIVLGFREEAEHRLVDLAECTVLDPAIVAAFGRLRELAGMLLGHESKGTTRRRAERSARITVTMLDHGLDVAFDAECGVLPGPLSASLARIAEQARWVRLSVDGDVIVMRGEPVLTVGGVAVELPPGVFLQAVPAAERALAELVVAAVGKAKRVVDLFSGLGTFTFPLARKAEVLALDGDRRAIAALTRAARHAQGLKRIEARVRDLFREPLSRTELKDFDAAVFDPPRAGAAEQAAALVRSKVPLVVAVSCNPATLARDARTLVDGGYELGAVTPVDQFLWTPHIEAVAVFRR